MWVPQRTSSLASATICNARLVNWCVAFTLVLSLWASITGCSNSREHQYTSTRISDLRRMPAFRAEVEFLYVDETNSLTSPKIILIGIRKEDGARLSFGGQSGGEDLRSFAKSLQQGKVYVFPNVLASFEKQQTHQIAEPVPWFDLSHGSRGN